MHVPIVLSKTSGDAGSNSDIANVVTAVVAAVSTQVTSVKVLATIVSVPIVEI